MKPWVVGLVVFLFTWSLTTHGKYSVSGDEPHYLMVTRSLAADGDLDVRNNYAQDDGRLFGHEGLEMEGHARVAPDGRLLPYGDVGLSIALVPVYAAAQRVAAIPSDATIRRFRMNRGLFAYSLISLVLIGITSAAIALLFAALSRVVRAADAAVVILATALSPPVVSHAFLVFPEVPAFAITCVVVWFVLRPALHHGGHGGRGGSILNGPDLRVLRVLRGEEFSVFGVALLLGLLPWVHRKYSPFVFGLAALVVWMRFDQVRAMPRQGRAAAAALFLVPQFALHAWTIATWGSIGGPQMSEGLPLSLSGIARGGLGLFADRTSGLLAYAPIYWLLPACAVAAWRRSWPFLAAAALLVLPMAAFVVWWGGFAPAARYLVPAVPLIAVPLALAMRRPWLRAAFVALLVPQAIIDASVWQHPRTLWPVVAGGNAALDRLGPIGRLYDWLLPAVQDRPLDWRAVAVVVAVALIALTAARGAGTASAPSHQRT